MAKKPTQASIAEALGVHRRTFRDWIRLGCPVGSVAAARRWAARREAARAKATPTTADEGLIRYRRARADLLEIQLHRAAENCADVETLIDTWEKFAAGMEPAVAELRERFGVEAAALIADAIRDADTYIRDRLAVAGRPTKGGTNAEAGGLPATRKNPKPSRGADRTRRRARKRSSDSEGNRARDPGKGG